MLKINLPKKILISLLAITSFLLLAITTSFAQSTALELTKIGTLDLGGNKYTEWWYTGKNPTLYGTAPASTVVTIKIDETSTTATADASGNWQAPTTITEGSHKIDLTSAAGNYSFTLTIGNAPAGTTTGAGGETTSGNTVPTTGLSGDLIALLLLSAGLIGTGLYGIQTAKQKA